jgi:hypothetical protein
MNSPVKQLIPANNSFTKLSVRLSAGQVLNRNGTNINCLECPLFPSIVFNQLICNNTICSSCGNYFDSLKPIGVNALVGIYARQEGLLEEVAYRELQKKFKIKISEPHSALPDLSGWYQVKNIKNQNLPLQVGITSIPFYGENQNLLGFAIVECTPENKKLIYPRTAWSFKDSPTEYFFNLPFSKPYPLYNWNLIANDLTVPVFLTDSIELAYWNSLCRIQGGIWTAWLGGAETAFDVRWDILRGRKVTHVLTQHSGLSMESIYKTALTANAKLTKVSGIDLNYKEYTPGSV